MYSLKRTITRNLVIAMLAAMGVLAIVMIVAFNRLFEGYLVTRLQHDAESLISVLARDSGGNWQIDGEHLSAVYHRVRSGHYYQLRIGEQLLTSRSLFDAQFPGTDSAPPDNGSYRVNGLGDERWLVWHQQAVRDDSAIRLWVAEDIAPVQRQLLKYSALAIVPVLLVTLLLVVLQRRILNQSFAVFEALRNNLAAIRQRETQRTGIHVPREIQPLVQEIERLVEQLVSRTRRTRNAIGNLAHELKQPVQLLRLKTNDRDANEWSEPINAIEAVIQRELKRAKIVGSGGSGGQFDIRRALPSLIDVLASLHPSVRIHVEVGEIVAAIELDGDDMLELIGNLLDNACKFARQNVWLAIDFREQRLFMTIEDDGEGLAPEQMRRISDRGVRLDESKAGHGLGLAICRDIVDSYHGELAFSASPRGGLRVAVILAL